MLFPLSLCLSSFSILAILSCLFRFVDEGVFVSHIVWMWNVVTAWGMYDFARARWVALFFLVPNNCLVLSNASYRTRQHSWFTIHTQSIRCTTDGRMFLAVTFQQQFAVWSHFHHR